MPKQLCLSIVVDMPTDPFDAAGIYVKLKQPWGNLLAELENSNVQHEAKVDELEVRAKPAASNGTGARRGRKPRERLPTVDDVRGILREQQEASNG